MAKLYFKFGAMGSSKTANALMTRFNYQEKGKKVWLIKPAIDNRDGETVLRSRVGLEANAQVIKSTDRILDICPIDDIDVIICTPSVMAKVGVLGKILGPRGLMPNPKTGTVTMEIGNAVKEVKAGKIDFKVDKTGIIHAGIGKASFTPRQICENATAFLNEVLKLKPQALKGTYMKGATICTTMSPAIKLDVKGFNAE